MYYNNVSGGTTNNISNNYYIIKDYGEKNKVNLNYIQLENGDLIFVETKDEYNSWYRFKEIVTILAQISTIFAVINQQ